MLLELGFLPTAKCIRDHLKVIKRRLIPINCHNPGEYEERDPWLLRTRHVAWVLGCLAEMPWLELAASEKENLRTYLERALSEYQGVVTTAADYLLGSENKGPATWVGKHRGEELWSEVWEQRSPNLLNTLYAALALCRAERHGYLAEFGNAGTPVSRATTLFDEILVKSVVVKPTAIGPQVLWKQDWHEEWAKRDLPDGIVGLLALGLMEYSCLLQEASAPGSEEEMRALSARTKAQRLAHVLVSRASADRRVRKGRHLWTTSADAFFNQKAEGVWFVPSYSVCLSAILETSIVHPNHSVVTQAFETISGLAEVRNYRLEKHVKTWIDPTRAPEMREMSEEVRSRQHAKVDFAPLFLGQDPTRKRGCQVNAAGLYAAVMAYGALRRAVARVDPREVLAPPPADEKPASPFQSIRARRDGAWWELTLSDAESPLHVYKETAKVSKETMVFLKALSRIEKPAPANAIAQAVDSLAGDTRHVGKESTVRQKITKINKRFGVRLIDSIETPSGCLYALTARLDAD
jgi:hypothetical protein